MLLFNWIRIRIRLPFILFAMLELNLITLAYYCFIQFKLLAFDNFESKLSIILTYTFLFILLIYSVAFYFLIYRLYSSVNSQALLNNTVHSFKSYIHLTMNIPLKQFIDAYIHSTYDIDYSVKISLLLANNLIQVIIFLWFRKIYQKRIFLVLQVIYSFSFAVLDMLFLVHHLDASTEDFMEYA